MSVKHCGWMQLLTFYGVSQKLTSTRKRRVVDSGHWQGPILLLGYQLRNFSIQTLAAGYQSP